MQIGDTTINMLTNAHNLINYLAKHTCKKFTETLLHKINVIIANLDEINNKSQNIDDINMAQYYLNNILVRMDDYYDKQQDETANRKEYFDLLITHPSHIQ